MSQEREELYRRIEEKREEAQLSPRALSIRATGKPDAIRDMKRRGSAPSVPTLAHIAEVLGTTTDWLLGKTDSPEQPRSEVSFREAPVPFSPAGGEGIPLVGTAWCDDLAVEGAEGEPYQVERLLLDSDHTVRMVYRPPALWAAKDAYAIYFHGTSMEPRFRQGDIGVVDPRRPPGPGDDVVVQLNDGNGGKDVVTVLVKELVRTSGSFVELRQFNPDITFRIPRRQVTRLHRIVPMGELLGG